MKIILSVFLILSISFFFNENLQSQMYWNQATTFGNSSRYISIPNSPSLNITGSFTIEAWINPTSLVGASKGIISKGTSLGSTLRYGIRLQSNGKLSLVTNGFVRLISKSTIQTNRWTHIAATFDSLNSVFSFLIDGITDTSSTVPGAAPVSNSDSLYIGVSGASTPFNGKIDEVRVWRFPWDEINLKLFMRSTLGVSGDQGALNSLVLSITMQSNTGISPLHVVKDFSGKGNDGLAHNLIVNDLSDRPLDFLQINDCIDLAFVFGYLSANDDPVFSPTSKLTIECWIFPKSKNCGILYKGSFLSFNPNYALHIENNKLVAYINNTQILSNDSVKLNRWNHIAFTYFGATGRYEFYLDGKRRTTGNKTPGNIIDGTDSLFLGGSLVISPYFGYIDEFRITHELKSINEIQNSMFESINESNDNDAVLNAVYNFDGLTWPSTDNCPVFNPRHHAVFNFNGDITGVIQSPVNNYSSHTFQKGFFLKMPNKRIPETGMAGSIKDTIDIPLISSVSDLNLFIAVNHKREDHLRLTLTSPLGTSVEFYSNYSLLDSLGNIVTVFDSDADSSLASNRYASFSPIIKPQFDFDANFSGQNTSGKWILTINDDSGPDTGTVIAWGIQFNNLTSVPISLQCTSLIEGFYNSDSNMQIADTVRYYLRNIVSPYLLIDSSKALTNNTGFAQALFSEVEVDTDYFLVIKHRNSVETWSSSIIQFASFTKNASYDFTTAASKAFGDNMVQVDNSPVKFAVYGGDVNQDGSVELSDIVQIFNDANNFLSGYVVTDVTGDDFVDLSDLALAFNNSNNFIGVIKP